MFGFLAPLLIKGGIFAGKKIAQAIGGHHGILGSAAKSFSGLPSAATCAISGLGARFFLGAITTLYFTNDTFAHGADICIGVVKSIIVHRLGSIF